MSTPHSIGSSSSFCVFVCAQYYVTNSIEFNLICHSAGSIVWSFYFLSRHHISGTHFEYCIFLSIYSVVFLFLECVFFFLHVDCFVENDVYFCFVGRYQLIALGPLSKSDLSHEPNGQFHDKQKLWKMELFAVHFLLKINKKSIFISFYFPH